MWHSGPSRNPLAETRSIERRNGARAQLGVSDQPPQDHARQLALDPGTNAAENLGYCQIPACRSPLHTGNTRPSYARYKLCMKCITADFVQYKDATSRWCQKCSRFQPLQDFEGTRRTCRRALERRAARRWETLPRAGPPGDMNPGASSDEGAPAEPAFERADDRLPPLDDLFGMFPDLGAVECATFDAVFGARVEGDVGAVDVTGKSLPQKPHVLDYQVVNRSEANPQQAHTLQNLASDLIAGLWEPQTEQNPCSPSTSDVQPSSMALISAIPPPSPVPILATVHVKLPHASPPDLPAGFLPALASSLAPGDVLLPTTLWSAAAPYPGAVPPSVVSIDVLLAAADSQTYSGILFRDPKVMADVLMRAGFASSPRLSTFVVRAGDMVVNVSAGVVGNTVTTSAMHAFGAAGGPDAGIATGSPSSCRSAGSPILLPILRPTVADPMQEIRVSSWRPMAVSGRLTARLCGRALSLSSDWSVRCVAGEYLQLVIPSIGAEGLLLWEFAAEGGLDGLPTSFGAVVLSTDAKMCAELCDASADDDGSRTAAAALVFGLAQHPESPLHLLLRGAALAATMRLAATTRRLSHLLATRAIARGASGNDPYLLVRNILFDAAAADNGLTVLQCAAAGGSSLTLAAVLAEASSKGSGGGGGLSGLSQAATTPSALRDGTTLLHLAAAAAGPLGGGDTSALLVLAGASGASLVSFYCYAAHNGATAASLTAPVKELGELLLAGRDMARRALHLAADAGSRGAVISEARALVDSGCAINLLRPVSEQQAALHVACSLLDTIRNETIGYPSTT